MILLYIYASTFFVKQENIFFRVSQRLQIGFDAQCLSKTAVEPNQEDVEPEAFILTGQMVKKDSASGNSTQKSVKENFWFWNNKHTI